MGFQKCPLLYLSVENAIIACYAKHNDTQAIMEKQSVFKESWNFQSLN
jgi:hypothetical protein